MRNLRSSMIGFAPGDSVHPMQETQVWTRTFTGKAEQLQSIHAFVDQVTKELQLDEEDAFACRLSVDEAVTNAFEHAYGGQPGAVELSIWCEAGDVYLSVRNWGEPF